MPAKQPNGVYYIDTTVNGIRVKQSLKTKNKSKAQLRERKILDKLLTDALQRAAGIEPEPVQLEVAPRLREFYEKTFEPWADDNYKGRERTLNSLKDRMALVLSYEPLATTRLDSLSEFDLDNFKARLVARRYQGRTINRTLGALRFVLRRAQRWSRNLGYKVYVPDFSEVRAKERKHKRVVTAAEEKAYGAACLDRSQFVYFQLLINTGMEPGYVVPARWEDVHFDGNTDMPNGWIHDKCQKNEYRERDIPLRPSLKQLLREWWMESGRPSTGWLFPADEKKKNHRPLSSFQTAHKRMFGKSLNKRRGKGKRSTVMAHLQRKYGVFQSDGEPVPYFRLYDLRHTFLTRLGEEGVTEIEMMAIAGWSSTRMAATYVHPSKRRIARAIERLDQPRVAAD
jgi:integrase